MRTWAILLAGGETQYIEHDGDDPSRVVAGAIDAAEMPRLPNDWERWDWDAAAIVADLDRLAAMLAARVDRERATAGEAVLTPGRTIEHAYVRKGTEAAAWTALDAAAREALDGGAAAAEFPFLWAEAAARRVSIDTVAGEIEIGRAASEARLAAIEARARVAKLAIRGATDADEMWAAAAVEWS